MIYNAESLKEIESFLAKELSSDGYNLLPCSITWFIEQLYEAGFRIVKEGKGK